MRLLGTETEDEGKRFVDDAQFTRIEPASGAAESSRVDDAGSLNMYACLDAVDVDARSKACGTCAGRSGCDQDGAEAEELIRLDDDGVSCAALLAAAAAAWRRQAEQFPADHLLGKTWSQVGELFADDLHLFDIGFIGCESADFVSDRRTDPSASGGFT